MYTDTNQKKNCNSFNLTDMLYDNCASLTAFTFTP